MIEVPFYLRASRQTTTGAIIFKSFSNICTHSTQGGGGHRGANPLDSLFVGHDLPTPPTQPDLVNSQIRQQSKAVTSRASSTVTSRQQSNVVNGQKSPFRTSIFYCFSSLIDVNADFQKVLEPAVR
jgi:hypothetical protein